MVFGLSPVCLLISPECHQHIKSEHPNKGDSRNSAFPHCRLNGDPAERWPIQTLVAEGGIWSEFEAPRRRPVHG